MNTTETATAALASIYAGHMRPDDARVAAETVVSGWSNERVTAYALAARGYTVSDRVFVHPATGSLVFPVTFSGISADRHYISTVAYAREGRIEVSPSAVHFPGPRRAMLAAEREARDIVETATV